ncbi:MAG: MBL fold metallo-hydrolase [Spirochaetales bacterium]|nr:MBL fold metallo-hydrolase [Spirochaetales bacterium]MCF7938140.1 MBL fold metallo-hydrolase [Spirochaetales bacterium]
MIERLTVGSLKTNSYIFSHEKKRCIIVDPGGDASLIIQRMETMNLQPVGIVCTHGHLDHIGALAELVQHFLDLGVDLPIAIHELDKDYLGEKAYDTHYESFRTMGQQGEAIFASLFTPPPNAGTILEEGDKVFDSNLKVLHTPGHTQGSISLYDENEEALISGDTIFFEGVGRTDLPGGSMEDLKTSILEKIFTLPPETRIYPGHGPISSVEREKRHNPYFN